MAETETGSIEYKAENKPETSFTTASTPSSRKFTDAAQFKSTSHNEWTTKYITRCMAITRPFTEIKPCWTGLPSARVNIWIISMCCTLWKSQAGVARTSITPLSSTTKLMLYVGSVSVNLKLTTRVFSRHSSFLPPQKSTPIWRVCLSMGNWFPPTTIPLTKF